MLRKSSSRFFQNPIHYIDSFSYREEIFFKEGLDKEENFYNGPADMLQWWIKDLIFIEIWLHGV